MEMRLREIGRRQGGITPAVLLRWAAESIIARDDAHGFVRYPLVLFPEVDELTRVLAEELRTLGAPALNVRALAIAVVDRLTSSYSTLSGTNPTASMAAEDQANPASPATADDPGLPPPGFGGII